MTKEVKIGSLRIGGNNPITIQTMYDSPLPEQIDELIQRLYVLKGMGCDIIRFSFSKPEDSNGIKKLVKKSPMPIVADIHFDYKLAIQAIECGVDKIRINPGNIGPKWKTEEIIRAAKANNIAVRIGLNSGSLPKNDDKIAMEKLMSQTALEYISWFENLNFYNTIVSLKASDPEITYKAAMDFASKSDYPQHLGVTEAGGVISSCVRGTWTLGRLLNQNIGATLRYSITGSLEDEVAAGVELLRVLGKRKSGINIVSCPRCGRHTFDTQSFYNKVYPRLISIDKNMTVAIMGCQVNGPGEASHADLAITGIGNKVFLYKKAKLERQVSILDAEKALFDEIESF